MSVKISWNQHEIALLIDLMMNVNSGLIVRKEAVKELSNELRNAAIAHGIQIDDTFRNISGIGMQLTNIETFFVTGKITRNLSASFVKMVQLYKNNNPEFNRILMEAKKVSKIERSLRDSFFSWMADKVSAAQLSELYFSFAQIEYLCLKTNGLKKPLFEIFDLETIALVKSRIGSNQGFRTRLHKNSLNKCISAIDFYYSYLNEKFTETHESKDRKTVLVRSSDNKFESNLVGLESNTERDIKKNVDRQKNSATFYESKNVDTETRDILENAIKPERMNTNPNSLNSLFNEWLISQGFSESASRSIEEALSRADDYALKRALIPAKIIEAQTYKEARQRILAVTTDNGFQINDEKYRKCFSIALNQYLRFLIPPLKGLVSPKSTENESIDILVIHAFEEHYKIKTKYVNIDKDLKELKIPIETVQKIVRNQGVFFQLTSDNYILIGWIIERLELVLNRVTELSKTDVLDIIRDVAKTPLMRLHQFHSLFFPDSNKLKWEYLAELKKSYRENLSKIATDQLDFEKSSNDNQKQTDGRVLKQIDAIQYKDLLTEHFPKGYRIESRLELNRFRNFWFKKHLTELTKSDEEIRKVITSITIRYQDFVYLPEMMLSLEKEALLIAYIEKCFANGKQTVYYKALFKEFEHVFREEQINNSDMLKVFLDYRNPRDWHHCSTYITKDTNPVVNTFDEVCEFYSSQTLALENEEVYNALSHIPQSNIYQVLATHREFVNNARGQYFHISAFTISKEEINKIADLIKHEINSKHFISGNELIEIIEAKHPEIIHHNAQFSPLGMRDAIGYYLGDQFSFKGNIISEIGYNLSMADVFEGFCKSRQSFSIAELNDLKRALNTVIYFNIVYANSLRISETDFVSKDRAMFDPESTDIAIDGFCRNDFIPLAEITHFGSFPYAGFPWNSYLLEHYVSEYSIRYKLLHTSFNATACVGAIVKRDTDIDDYNGLLAQVLAKSSITLRKDESLQFLYDRGYIAKRRITEIEQVISKARGLR